MVSDALIGLVRTAVPALIGACIAWLITAGYALEYSLSSSRRLSYFDLVAPNDPITTAELLLAVEKLERKIDSLTYDLKGVNDRLEGIKQWSTWMIRLTLGAVITLVVTSVVSILLQR